MIDKCAAASRELGTQPRRAPEASVGSMKPFAVWAAAFAFAVAGPAHAAGAAPELPGPAVGAPAPDFSLTTLDGKRVRLPPHPRQTPLLHGLGSSCPPPPPP